MDLYCASVLKQQSAARHVASLLHIILIYDQPVSLLFLCVTCLEEKQHNTYSIVFGLIRLGLEPTIYRNGGEHANQHTSWSGHSLFGINNKLKSLLNIFIGPSVVHGHKTILRYKIFIVPRELLNAMAYSYQHSKDILHDLRSNWCWIMLLYI